MMKHRAKFLSAVCILSGFTVFAQSPVTESADNTAKNLKDMEKHVLSIEESLNELLNFRKNQKNSEELVFHLGSNIEVKYGSRTRRLEETWAFIGYSGGKINNLSFRIKKANLANHSETIYQIIERKNFLSESFDNLTLVEKMDREFVQNKETARVLMKNLNDPLSRRRMLQKYRDTLTRLEYFMQAYKIKVLKQHDRKLNSILAN